MRQKAGAGKAAPASGRQAGSSVLEPNPLFCPSLVLQREGQEERNKWQRNVKNVQSV